MKKVYWKDIPGYEGLYEASNYGDIKSFKFGKERIMKQSITKGEYYQIELMKDGNRKRFYVHQLVAQAFLYHVIDGHNLVINHINGIKTDNRVENLEIVSNRDNSSFCHRKDRDTMSSPLPGAIFNKKTKKWHSQYHYKGKRYYLGFYDIDKEASDKWKEAYEADKNGIFEQFILTIENKQIKSVNQYTKSGEFIREWKSATEAGKELGIANENITSCCRGKLKSAGRYVWEYKE